MKRKVIRSFRLSASQADFLEEKVPTRKQSAFVRAALDKAIDASNGVARRTNRRVKFIVRENLLAQ
jgi:hypothetical protein